jgi:acetyltransferase
MNLIHRYLCRSAYWRKAVETRIFPWALKDVDLGFNVLEVGPGPGVTTDLLCARVPRLTCVEIDKSLAAMRSVIAHAQVVRAKIPPTSVAQKPKPQLAKKLSRAGGALNEVESKSLLKAYGIAVPKESVARSEKEAVALATKIGFPVVAKAVSAALAHKTEAGAVLLDLKSGKDVRAAYKAIMAAGKRAKVALDGVLIAEQVFYGIELVLGVHRDPEMGPVILFGAGGVELELHPDVAFAVLPLDEAAALGLIARTRVAKIIEGYRGGKALDRKALVKALLGLSQLALDAGVRLQSIDVNPFLLKRRGGVALDALVVLTGATTA